MPKARAQKLTAWSFSVYQEYGKCPFKTKCKKILRLPEPQGDAASRGDEAHALARVISLNKVVVQEGMEHLKPMLTKALALYNKTGELPECLETFEDEFKALRKVKGLQTELMWCFKRDWTPTVWNDWNNTWLRIKVDAYYIKKAAANVIDYKTGKMYEDHAQQRSLYALGLFLTHEDVKTVQASHWYLDPGEEKIEEWDRSQLEALKQEWLNRTTALLNDTTFAPRPGGHCTWCPFQKAKGGPCEF